MESTPIITKSQLVRNINEVRKRRDVNLAWLADEIDMNLPTIWRKLSLEYADKNQPRVISAIELHQMSLALKVSMNFLLNPGMTKKDQFWNLKPFRKE